MSRYLICWDADAQEWSVEDNVNDRVVVARFPSLHEAETYVIERSERSER